MPWGLALPTHISYCCSINLCQDIPVLWNIQWLPTAYQIKSQVAWPDHSQLLASVLATTGCVSVSSTVLCPNSHSGMDIWLWPKHVHALAHFHTESMLLSCLESFLCCWIPAWSPRTSTNARMFLGSPRAGTASLTHVLFSLPLHFIYLFIFVLSLRVLVKYNLHTLKSNHWKYSFWWILINVYCCVPRIPPPLTFICCHVPSLPHP